MGDIVERKSLDHRATARRLSICLYLLEAGGAWLLLPERAPISLSGLSREPNLVRRVIMRRGGIKGWVGMQMMKLGRVMAAPRTETSKQ